MKKSVKGTKTEQNLMIAFASESMAVNRYTYFAEASSREGYEQITTIFMETAEDERAFTGMTKKLLLTVISPCSRQRFKMCLKHYEKLELYRCNPQSHDWRVSANNIPAFLGNRLDY